MSDISNKILKAMKNKNISYGELSKLTDIPKSALQRYATGETTKIPLNRIETLAKILNIDSAYLIGWDNSEKEKPSNERELTEDELKLIELFERVPENRRKELIHLIESALKMQGLL